MTIPEAARLVLQAGGDRRQRRRCFVLDMGEPVKIVDLARDLIRLSGQHAGRDPDRFRACGRARSCTRSCWPTPTPRCRPPCRGCASRRLDAAPAPGLQALLALAQGGGETGDAEVRLALRAAVPEYASR